MCYLIRISSLGPHSAPHPTGSSFDFAFYNPQIKQIIEAKAQALLNLNDCIIKQNLKSQIVKTKLTYLHYFRFWKHPTCWAIRALRLYFIVDMKTSYSFLEKNAKGYEFYTLILLRQSAIMPYLRRVFPLCSLIWLSSYLCQFVRPPIPITTQPTCGRHVTPTMGLPGGMTWCSRFFIFLSRLQLSAGTDYSFHCFLLQFIVNFLNRRYPGASWP